MIVSPFSASLKSSPRRVIASSALTVLIEVLSCQAQDASLAAIFNQLADGDATAKGDVVFFPVALPLVDRGRGRHEIIGNRNQSRDRRPAFRDLDRRAGRDIGKKLIEVGSRLGRAYGSHLVPGD